MYVWRTGISATVGLAHETVYRDNWRAGSGGGICSSKNDRKFQHACFLAQTTVRWVARMKHVGPISSGHCACVIPLHCLATDHFLCTIPWVVCSFVPNRRWFALPFPSYAVGRESRERHAM